MKTNHRHYILLLFALATIIVSIFGYVFLRAAVLSEAVQSAQLIKEANLIDEKKQHEQGVTSLYTQSAESREKLRGYLVAEESVVTLIEEIEKIGADTNAPIELGSISSEDASKGSAIALSSFKAHVEARGTWADVMRDLVLLEKMPHSVSISNVRLFNSGEMVASELPVKGTPVKTSQWRLSLDIKILTTK